MGDDNTSVSGVLNFYHRNSIFNRDRGYSSNTNDPSVNASPINLRLSRTAVIAAGVPDASLPQNPSTGLPLANFFGHAPFFTNGVALASAYTYTPFPAVGFNFNAYAEALPDSERYGGFWNATHKICGDQLVLYADMFYQNVQTSYELAPTATGPFQTPGHVILAIPPHAPGPTLGGPTYQDTGVPMGAFNPFNPFQQIISERTLARLIEFGNRIRDNETKAYFSTLGLKGDKLFDGNWGYDAGFRYSETKNTSSDTQVSASRFNRILNAADPIFDPTSPQFIGTTTPYNPFGDFRRPIATNALPIDFALIHPNQLISPSLPLLILIFTQHHFSICRPAEWVLHSVDNSDEKIWNKAPMRRLLPGILSALSRVILRKRAGKPTRFTPKRGCQFLVLNIPCQVSMPWSLPPPRASKNSVTTIPMFSFQKSGSAGSRSTNH